MSRTNVSFSAAVRTLRRNPMLLCWCVSRFNPIYMTLFFTFVHTIRGGNLRTCKRNNQTIPCKAITNCSQKSNQISNCTRLWTLALKVSDNASLGVQLGAYLLLFCGVTAEEAYAPLSMFEPFLPFRDPTCGVSTYHLTVMDCIRVQLTKFTEFHRKWPKYKTL